MLFSSFILSLGLIVIFFGSYWVYEAKVFKSTTKAYANVVSADNSYCFTSPLCVDADGVQTQRITLFCLNPKGTGLQGLSGKLTTDPDVSFKVVQPISDSEGKIIFDVSSKVKKDIKLEAVCGGVKINCQPQICFK